MPLSNESDPSPGPSHRHARSSERPSDDVGLVAELRRDDASAWQHFFAEYSGLIYVVVRRQLFVEDEDEVRDVFVEVLHKLHQGKISEYEGRAPLAAWLIVVARGTALDYLRKRDGRDQPPSAIRDLSNFERDVLRLRYVEGMTIDLIGDMMRARGLSVTSDELVETCHKIEHTLGARYMRKLEYDHHAAIAGVASGRLLRYLVHSRPDRSTEVHETPLERLLAMEETEARASRVHRLLAQLPDQERTVLRLRYIRGIAATAVAKMLGFRDAQTVYSVTRRAVDRLLRAESSRGRDR